MPAEEAVRRKDFLWNAMLTEYDAANLASYLSSQAFSPDFHRFERAWRHDEWNHYLGFRRLFAILYEDCESEIENQLRMDSGNFRPISHFLGDEFKVCLLLAYDEIATFKSYLAEFPFYRSFGDTRVFRWFQRVTNDELNHFMNSMEIIKHRHSARIPEVDETLDSLIEWDVGRHPYERTFVLDHYWYSLRFLEHCKELIRDYFRNGLNGVNFATTIEVNEAKTIGSRYRYT